MSLKASRTHSVLSRSVAETRAEAARLARAAQPGDVYALVGPLGAGKTEFVRGFVDALAPEAPVRSPSFTLLNVYETPGFPVYHFDFYRVRAASELTEVGLAEYLDGAGVCLVEWADLFPAELPRQATLTVRFEDLGQGVRRITTEAPHRV